MTRLTIDFPSTHIFSTELTVHNSYINRANHVGNNNFVEICSEALMRFFAARGTAEYRVGEQDIINTAFSVEMLAEVKMFDRLRVDLAVGNFHKRGCDFFYRLTKRTDGDTRGSGNTNTNASTREKAVALARFSMLTFDYETGKSNEADAGFRAFFESCE